MRTAKLHVNCSISWRAPGVDGTSPNISQSCFLDLAEVPLSAHPMVKVWGETQVQVSSQSVYVFTAKSGWELARIIVYKTVYSSLQSGAHIREETPVMGK